MLAVTARRLDNTAARPHFTRRETQVLAGLAAGFTRKEIADRLGISLWTVNAHVSAAMKRNGARTSIQLMGIRPRGFEEAFRRWRNTEAPYRDELARHVSGQTEVRMPYGRADVMTDTDVFEVEPIHRWRKGLQQAVAYGVFSGLHPNLAIYSTTIVPLEEARAIWEGIRALRSPVGLWIRLAGAWARVTVAPDQDWPPGPPATW